MLHEFLAAERSNILDLCRSKLLEVGRGAASSKEMEAGLPVFYDELIAMLESDEDASDTAPTPGIHPASAVRRGRESLRLGYTISQVVQGYGALCQAITEYAVGLASNGISAREFNRLNFALDEAISQAVTEFNRGLHDNTARDEVQRLGFLAHELRNALATASTAHQLIKMGLVGTGGATNEILGNALLRMQELIDRSLSEVRLNGEVLVELQVCRLVDLVAEVEATAIPEAARKEIRLHVDVGADLVIQVDRHLISSAISNLLQNAIKFTRPSGHVWLRASANGEQVLLEVEDECGGLPPGKIEELFQPFTQKDADRSGVGLGLSICRRAVELNGGQTSARDLPGQGCVFSIWLPRMIDGVT